MELWVKRKTWLNLFPRLYQSFPVLNDKIGLQVIELSFRLSLVKAAYAQAPEL